MVSRGTMSTMYLVSKKALEYGLEAIIATGEK